MNFESAYENACKRHIMLFGANFFSKILLFKVYF